MSPINSSHQWNIENSFIQEEQELSASEITNSGIIGPLEAFDFNLCKIYEDQKSSMSVVVLSVKNHQPHVMDCDSFGVAVIPLTQSHG